MLKVSKRNAPNTLSEKSERASERARSCVMFHASLW